MKLVEQNEAEQADFVCCVKKVNDPGTFSDNLEGTCSICGETVVFRPHAPQKPPKICMECAIAIVGSKQALAKYGCATNRSFVEAVNETMGGNDDTGGTRH